MSKISNSEFTIEEYALYKQAAQKSGFQMLTKKLLGKKVEQMTKILKQQWGASEIENLVAKKLEQKIKNGNFNQISNIPFEISRLRQELAEIAK